jgi:hypothetical protein
MELPYQVNWRVLWPSRFADAPQALRSREEALIQRQDRAHSNACDGGLLPPVNCDAM